MTVELPVLASTRRGSHDAKHVHDTTWCGVPSLSELVAECTTSAHHPRDNRRSSVDDLPHDFPELLNALREHCRYVRISQR
jgi:hypothetical protein